MPGVNFTKESAERIGRVVRTVEGTPPHEVKTQRRRSGGTRTASLWKVTAVQTTPKTVTIKRVADDTFTLNDPSETIDVLYDPDNEPAVDDFGLLIRLADGTRFFFRKSAGGPVVVYLDDYRYIINTSPDSTFGSGGREATARLESGGTEKRGVMKFERQITESDPIFDSVVLRECERFTGQAMDNNITGQSNIVFRLDVYKITEDFDPASVTWNNYGPLSKTKVNDDGGGTFGVWPRSDVTTEKPEATGQLAAFYMGLWKGNAEGSRLKWDLSNAYGLGLHIVVKSTSGDPDPYYGDVTFRRGSWGVTYPDSYVIAGLEQFEA